MGRAFEIVTEDVTCFTRVSLLVCLSTWGRRWSRACIWLYTAEVTYTGMAIQWFNRLSRTSESSFDLGAFIKSVVYLGDFIVQGLANCLPALAVSNWWKVVCGRISIVACHWKMHVICTHAWFCKKPKQTQLQSLELFLNSFYFLIWHNFSILTSSLFSSSVIGKDSM